MKNFTVPFILLLACLCAAQEVNLYPVIGIISIPVESWYPETDKSYIAASYVKFVEAGGSRVVPIPWDATNITDYLDIVDGVLFTGGDSQITTSMTEFELTPFGKSLQKVIDYVKASKNYMPLWGTCQGFEAIMILESQTPEILTNCTKCTNVSKNIKFVENGRLYDGLPQRIKNNAESDNLTFFNEDYMVSTKGFNDNKNLESYTILATTEDQDGTPYVASFQNKNYPIYGVQFHPEKSTFEWRLDKPSNINHSFEAVEFEQWLGNFFVNECRQNENAFDDDKYDSLLIYSFNATVVESSPFSQVYLFDSQDIDATTVQAEIYKEYKENKKEDVE